MRQPDNHPEHSCDETAEMQSGNRSGQNEEDQPNHECSEGIDNRVASEHQERRFEHENDDKESRSKHNEEQCHHDGF